MSEKVLTIASELAEITRLVEDDDFPRTLDRFARRAVFTVPGCDHALVTVRTAGRVETVAGAGADVIDPTLPGPVVEAVTYNEPRRLDDVSTDQRWPVFAAHLAKQGIRSCLALPLASRTDTSAVFTLCSSVPNQFADTAYDIALLLTLHAGAAFDNVTLYHNSTKLVEQLRTALRTRSLVGQAQGLLMHRFDFDAGRAFEALRVASQNSNTKLRDLARVLVDSHAEGRFEATLHQLALATEARSTN